MTVNGSSTYTGQNIFYTKRELQELAKQLAQRQDADAPAAYDMNDFHYSPANHSYANSTQRFLWDPPYAIHNGIHSSEGDLVDNLNKKTVAMDAVSAGGKFYDVHNIDGSLLMIHTHNALLNIHPDRRPFIVGRSTYPGVGKYVNHWLGDNYSQWSYMAASIQGMLQFQLFGIPTVGPDTCGFNGNTDEELCNRWMMQSAFVPFFRQHNTEGAIDQAPYVWPSVANASRNAIRKRYELLPEIYSARARSSQKGTPMVKSLWMEFTSQAHFAALHKTDSQFMLGSNLLVSPVLEPNVSSIQAYFPEANGLWRNIFTYEALDVPANTNTTISAPLSTINVHLRPGRAILTFKEARYTIGETAKQPYKLIVSVDRSGSATGGAYVDDGSSNLPTPSKELTFKAVSGSLSGSADGDYYIDNKLDDFILLGIAKQPEKITVNGRDAHSSFIFDAERNLLNITQADIDINKAWTVTWS
jgi:alpha-glucosidase